MRRWIAPISTDGTTDMVATRFPEPQDLVSVTERHVEYFGYVDAMDYDLRAPRVNVEFFPGCRRWFDLSEVRLVKFPEALNSEDDKIGAA